MTLQRCDYPECNRYATTTYNSTLNLCRRHGAAYRQLVGINAYNSIVELITICTEARNSDTTANTEGNVRNETTTTH